MPQPREDDGPPAPIWDGILDVVGMIEEEIVERMREEPVAPASLRDYRSGEPLPWEDPGPIVLPTTQATPYFYRRTTPLVEEIDALTGYDSAGLYAAFEAEVVARHQAKKEVARLSSLAVSLRAKWESKGTTPSQADREHKARVAELAQRMRKEYYEDPEMEESPPKFKGGDPVRKVIRLTADDLDQRVRSLPEYREFLDEQGREREEYEDVKRQLDEAWADYELHAGLAEYLTIQLEERKSMVFYLGQGRRHVEASAGA